MGKALTFRKKPVEIQAMQWDGTEGDAVTVVAWVLTGHGTATWHKADGIAAHISIDTLEGVMRVGAGDWVIRGVRGEHYPCKPEIFEATYVRLDGDA